MECCKFHVMQLRCGTSFFYRQQEMLPIQLQIKPMLVHRTVDILLAYLNWHAYNDSICSGFHSHWQTCDLRTYFSIANSCMLLAITIITVYPITTQSCATKQKEQAVYSQAGLLAEIGNCFRHNISCICDSFLSICINQTALIAVIYQ